MLPKYRYNVHNIIKYLIIISIQCVIVECDSKSSLTFVIDDTDSMSNDIKQVIKGADSIFDTVMNHNDSQIDNFVLVTFNDPTTIPRRNTRDRKVFKDALKSIVVDGGGDCPEYSMSGIKLALENSLPGSYIYVFTDASSKDHHLYESVKSLALSKQAQIVFVLTDECRENEGSYDVYPGLADATLGAVFHLERNEIGKILDYVKNSITERKTILIHDNLPPGKSSVTFPVDSKTKDPTVAVSSHKEIRSVDLTGPDGKTPDSITISKSKKITILNIIATVPGDYKIDVDSESGSSVLVTAKTEILFQHGFSTTKPTSAVETTTLPIPGTKSHISIGLTKGNIPLVAVKIYDLKKELIPFVAHDDTLVVETPLYLVNDRTQFYVTQTILPPNSAFLIAIVGYDPESKTNITRFSSPIEPQKVFEEDLKTKQPTVTIEGGANLNVAYNDSVKLICKVEGYPKPDIVWINKANGNILPGKVSVYKLPDEFINILAIDNVKENTTYKCKANNTAGSNAKTVTVITTEPPKHFIVDRTDRVTKIDYKKEGQIHCKVDAYPPAQIVWLRDRKELLPTENIKISDDNSTITIIHANITDKGQYICVASNSDKRQLIPKYVTITDIDRPKINQSISRLSVNESSSAVMRCNVLQGKPKPSIKWSYATYGDAASYEDVEEWNGQETVELKDVKRTHAGRYLCEASNIVGADYHQIALIVQYAPTAKMDKNFIKVKEGDELTIDCQVDGIPTPNVTWFKEFSPMTDNLFNMNKTLNKTAEVSDADIFSCVAQNEFGTATSKTQVVVIVPPHITRRLDKKVVKKVGDRLSLPCEAEGLPEPNVEWIYRKFNSSEKGTKLGKILNITRIQVREEGSYTCVASSPEGSTNFTYDVHVFAPPTIESLYKSKNLMAVEGDVGLLITCNASGNPKPIIAWKKDGLDVALGPLYMQFGDMLIIRNIQKGSEGIYNCEARNFLGSAQDIFEVSVDRYPRLKSQPPSTILIKAETPYKISCGLNSTIPDDHIRWYKNGVLLNNTEEILKLDHPMESDAGLYACRVSNILDARTNYIQLDVGRAPVFTTEETLTVELKGPPARLRCEAYAVPIPTVTWYRNDVKLATNESTYILEMINTNYGKYTCEVKNEFGIITRTFNAVSNDCIINTNKLPKQPLLMDTNLDWPSFKTINKEIMIPKEKSFILYCASKFKKFPKTYLQAFCDEKAKIMVNGRHYEYSDLQCNDKVEYKVVKTGNKCLADDTEIMRIVYEFKFPEYPDLDMSREVYGICMNKTNKVPIYSVHTMRKTQALDDIEPSWSDKNWFYIDLDDAYNCKRQVSAISASLGRQFHRSGDCCFTRRQLVNPRDVFTGVPQRATYSYLNVVPHWSTCNTKNWDDLEKKVRAIARALYLGEITVWTGTAGQLSVPNGYNNAQKMYIQDRAGDSQPVPLYLWKVIQNPVSRASLAVVQLNIPDLSRSDASKYIPCRDICEDTNWMNSPHWRDVIRGYTFCCSIQDFERAFGYSDVFDTNMENILQMDTDTYELPVASSLTV